MTDDPAVPDAPPPGALCFAFRGGELLVADADGGGARVPRVADSGLDAADGVWVDAGEVDGLRCVAVSLPESATAPRGMRFVRLRAAYPLLPADVTLETGAAP